MPNCCEASRLFPEVLKKKKKRDKLIFLLLAFFLPLPGSPWLSGAGCESLSSPPLGFNASVAGSLAPSRYCRELHLTNQLLQTAVANSKTSLSSPTLQGDTLPQLPRLRGIQLHICRLCPAKNKNKDARAVESSKSQLSFWMKPHITNAQ